MATVILTVYGSDRPGLVQSIADAVLACQGNWLSSHLSRLAGMFVGSILVEVPEQALPDLRERLSTPGAAGLTVLVVPAQGAPGPAAEARLLTLELIGQDRPGIVREVTAVLAAQGVNIQSFETALTNSPWSGDVLFKAVADLEIPPGLTLDRLRSQLEHLSGEIMVDIALKEA